MTKTSPEPYGRKYLFIAPALIYFALFFFLPIIDEFRLSFTTGFTKLTPVGGRNYVNIIHDSEVWH